MFLRATFYRWVQLWPVIATGLAAAPHILAVGDLHVENFGTWRDSEGRWVWGINDVDEAFPMAYTIDLVRLSTSALFSKSICNLQTSDQDLINHILRGYNDCLEKGGEPIILAEDLSKLTKLAKTTSRDPSRYWKKLLSIPAVSDPVASEEIRQLLIKSLPDSAKPGNVVHRVAGLGSLGRPRFMMLTRWKGGLIAREAKPVVPSACYFAAHHSPPYKIHLAEIINRSVRSFDPNWKVENGWIIRRLSPDSGRIEIDKITSIDEEAEIFYWMGFEVGNIHLGSPKHAVDNVRNDLKTRPPGWLHNASLEMKYAIEQDYKEWQNYYNTHIQKPSTQTLPIINLRATQTTNNNTI